MDAWVTVIEFADFECRYCGDAQSTIRAVGEARPNVRWVFKHFPLTSIHSRALPAALAAECANAQGKFWEMHDTLFANQSRLGEGSLVSYAEALGLDMAAWDSCRTASDATSRISEDFDLGLSVGVAGTPTFFVNGSVLPGAYPAQEIVGRIDEAEAAALKSGTNAADYYATIETQGCPSSE